MLNRYISARDRCRSGLDFRMRSGAADRRSPRPSNHFNSINKSIKQKTEKEGNEK